VSHELRTPLTSLRAALGLVASGSLLGKPDKEKQMLDIAVSNSDRLTQLVNDILDLERIETGKLLMHCLDCDVTLLLRRAAEQMALASLRLDVRLEVAPSNQRVWADPDRILQTLTNLVGNAIKFSPRGSVVRLFATPAEKGFIRLSVCDEGRGIPQDKKELIFERFQQVDASDSRTMGGTGLGLAICRSIVVQHGGRIWVESQVNRGSCFHFTLPKNPPQR
jgi:two-component system sensor histidine kinase VicK